MRRYGAFEERANCHSENETGKTENTEVLSSEVCVGEVGDPKSIVVNNLSARVILFSSTETLKCRHTKEK